MTGPREVIADESGVRTILEGLLEHVPVDTFYWSTDHDWEVPGYLAQVRWQVRSWAECADLVKDKGIPSDQILEMARTSELLVRTSEARCNSPIVLRVGNLQQRRGKDANVRAPKKTVTASKLKTTDVAVQTSPQLGRAADTGYWAADESDAALGAAADDTSSPCPPVCEPHQSAPSSATSNTATTIPLPRASRASSPPPTTATPTAPTATTDKGQLLAPVTTLESTIPTSSSPAPDDTHVEEVNSIPSAVDMATSTAPPAGVPTPSAPSAPSSAARFTVVPTTVCTAYSPPSPSSSDEVCQIVLDTAGAGVESRSAPRALFARRAMGRVAHPLHPLQCPPLPRRPISPPASSPRTPQECVSVAAAVQRLEGLDGGRRHGQTAPEETPLASRVPRPRPRPRLQRLTSVLKGPDSPPVATKKHVSFNANLVQEIGLSDGLQLLSPGPEPEVREEDKRNEPASEAGLGDLSSAQNLNQSGMDPHFKIQSWNESRPQKSDQLDGSEPHIDVDVQAQGKSVSMYEPGPLVINTHQTVQIETQVLLGHKHDKDGQLEIEYAKETSTQPDHGPTKGMSHDSGSPKPKPFEHRVLPDILPVNTMTFSSPHTRTRRLSESFKAPYRSVPLCLPSPASDM